MKKLFALLLAVFMLTTLAIPTVSAEEPELGSITINGIGEDSKYDIYCLLDLESYKPASGGTAGAYSYKVNSAWAGFFATEDALKYVAIDNSGYVTWVNGNTDDEVAAFAKIALQYAKDNGIAPVKSSANDGEMTVTENTETKIKSGKFTNLPLGWYLVDSTVGALCGLTTTNPNASINAKNGTPTIDKQVLEDSTNQWGDSNTADIGQTVFYRVTVNVHAGAENYVFHDKMSKGLTFDAVTGISLVEPATPEATTTPLVAGTDYTVVADDTLEDDCTFEVRFTTEFCNKLDTNDKIIISYQAMLNRNAVIASTGNVNEAWLDYGEENHTTHDTTQTYTFGLDIIKTDSENTLLDGAEFKIYDAATGGNEVAVVLMDDGVTYRRAREDETGISIVVKDGNVRVVGFDNGTYFLEETVAPEGYNKLTARQKFIISDGNLDAVFNDGIFSTGSGVHVVNKTGSMLPETGGLGKTIFFTIGGVTMLTAAIFLFAKKRMSQIAE